MFVYIWLMNWQLEFEGGTDIPSKQMHDNKSSHVHFNSIIQ